MPRTKVTTTRSTTERTTVTKSRKSVRLISEAPDIEERKISVLIMRHIWDEASGESGRYLGHAGVPANFRPGHGLPIVEQLAHWLRRQGAVNPICAMYTPNCTWLTGADVTNPNTGDSFELEYIVSGLSPVEDADLFRLMTGRPAPVTAAHRTA